MNHKRAINHYCAQCRMTTAHDESEQDSRCRRCGAVKLHTRRVAEIQQPRKSPDEAETSAEAGCSGWN